MVLLECFLWCLQWWFWGKIVWRDHLLDYAASNWLSWWPGWFWSLAHLWFDTRSNTFNNTGDMWSSIITYAWWTLELCWFSPSLESFECGKDISSWGSWCSLVLSFHVCFEKSFRWRDFVFSYKGLQFIPVHSVAVIFALSHDTWEDCWCNVLSAVEAEVIVVILDTVLLTPPTFACNSLSNSDVCSVVHHTWYVHLL